MVIQKSIIRSAAVGLLGTIAILSFYIVIVTLVSGFAFTKEQFSLFWYYILALSIGFGIQVGLYQQVQSRKVLAVSGTSSTVAMISCCSHYLVNILPVLGMTGFISLIASYQIELFWVGIVANILGITYMLYRINNIKSKP